MNNFQKANVKAQGKLEGKPESKLEDHPHIAKELHTLIQNLPKMAMKQNPLTVTGNSKVGAQDITGSTTIINK